MVNSISCWRCWMIVCCVGDNRLWQGHFVSYLKRIHAHNCLLYDLVSLIPFSPSLCNIHGDWRMGRSENSSHTFRFQLASSSCCTAAIPGTLTVYTQLHCYQCLHHYFNEQKWIFLIQNREICWIMLNIMQETRNEKGGVKDQFSCPQSIISLDNFWWNELQ
jgi:hypothetical protein